MSGTTSESPLSPTDAALEQEILGDAIRDVTGWISRLPAASPWAAAADEIRDAMISCVLPPDLPRLLLVD